MSKSTDLNPRFKKGLDKVIGLSEDGRYQAAFVFGSVAEGTSNQHSDLDIKVIVDEDNPCENISHPSFDDYKLDITFRSFKQIEEFTEEEIKKSEREPNLVRAVILFDKTGELTKLKKKIQNIKRAPYTEKDYQFVHFMLYHANNKVERCLEDDPIASLYSMHANIGEVLKIHFKMHGKWWISSKSVIANLETWDKDLAKILKSFVSTSDVQTKFRSWSKIIDHVAKTMGGRQPIIENNCDCKVCKFDLGRLRD